MDSAVRADVLKRLASLYAAMDAAYEAAAAAYRFACTGCEESCCRTRFHHHTLVEYHGLRDGFGRLSAARQAEILARAESWIEMSGFRRGAVRRRSAEGRPAGVVVGQLPLSGHPVAAKGLIELTVAQ